MCHYIAQALFDAHVIALTQHLFNTLFRHHSTAQISAIMCYNLQGSHLIAPYRMASSGVHGYSTQPGVNGDGGNLPRADRLHGSPWTVLCVTAGKYPGHFGHQALRVGNYEATNIFDPATL